MNIVKKLLLVLLLLSFCSPAYADKPRLVSLQTEQASKRLSELTLQSAVVENDPLFGGDQTYFGYAVSEVLAAFDITLAEGDALRFHCRDGYKALFDPARFDISAPLFADLEASKERGIRFKEISEGKVILDPSPFAVIWPGKYVEGSPNPTPHGIIAIEVGAVRDFVGDAYPVDAPEVMEGFSLFQAKCIACHTLNMQGGEIGPELNVPKNVTEYWTKEHFEGFVTNPQNYRYKSRMMVGVIPQHEIKAIYQYLTVMRDQKVCSTLEECRQWDKAHPE